MQSLFLKQTRYLKLLCWLGAVSCWHISIAQQQVAAASLQVSASLKLRRSLHRLIKCVTGCVIFFSCSERHMCAWACVRCNWRGRQYGLCIVVIFNNGCVLYCMDCYTQVISWAMYCTVVTGLRQEHCIGEALLSMLYVSWFMEGNRHAVIWVSVFAWDFELGNCLCERISSLPSRACRLLLNLR